MVELVDWRASCWSVECLVTERPSSNLASGTFRHDPGIILTLVTAANFVSRLQRLEPGSSPQDAFSSIETVNLTGSAVTPTMRAAIAKLICPNVQISYGASETGGIALLRHEDADRPEGCAGRLYPWVQVEAVDEEDRLLPPGRAGNLRFKTPDMIHGYLNDAEATASRFRYGWFYSGDMGKVDLAGYVYLAGRSDHVVNVGGNKVDPYRIEEVINSTPGILESVVVQAVTTAGRPVLVAVVVSQGPVNEKEILKKCRELLERFEVPKAVLAMSALPKNAGGKVLRDKVAALIKATQAKQQAAARQV